MKTKTLIALLAAACLMTNSSRTRADVEPLTADLVIVNARVRTMDEKQPVAEAVAVYGNHILAVGSTAEIRKLAGARTRVVDAGGRLVLPGFNDAHVYFLSGGFQLAS